MTLAPLLAVLLAAADAPTLPVPAPLPVDTNERDWNEPPQGSPEDQALWRSLRDAGNAAVIAMSRLSQAAFRIRYGKYYEGLDEVARTQPSSAGRAGELRAALERAAREADEAVPKQGLRVRVCKYKLLDLDIKMGERDPKIVAELPGIRAEARACTDEIGTFAHALEPRADALERALGDVDAFLGRAPPAPPSPKWDER